MKCKKHDDTTNNTKQYTIYKMQSPHTHRGEHPKTST